MSLDNVRLAAFDMDGTLLNQSSEMAEATKEACRKLQASGCKLVLATGRTVTSAKLPIDDFPFDGYVCSNGATVHDGDGNLIHAVSIPAAMLLQAIPLIRQHSVYYEVHDVHGNRLMVSEDRDQIESLISQDMEMEGIKLRRLAFYKMARIVDLGDLLQAISSGETSIVKLFIWHQESHVLEQVAAQLARWTETVTITSSSKTNIEILASGVSKWTGLQYFLQKWGLSAEQAAAFGDADNDIEILSHVGHPIAMDNAPEHIKQLAKYIAGDHDLDGVARFITEQMLPQR